LHSTHLFFFKSDLKSLFNLVLKPQFRFESSSMPSLGPGPGSLSALSFSLLGSKEILEALGEIIYGGPSTSLYINLFMCVYIWRAGLT
jgi:hypothetical protein